MAELSDVDEAIVGVGWAEDLWMVYFYSAVAILFTLWFYSRPSGRHEPGKANN